MKNEVIEEYFCERCGKEVHRCDSCRKDLTPDKDIICWTEMKCPFPRKEYPVINSICLNSYINIRDIDKYYHFCSTKCLNQHMIAISSQNALKTRIKIKKVKKIYCSHCNDVIKTCRTCDKKFKEGDDVLCLFEIDLVHHFCCEECLRLFVLIPDYDKAKAITKSKRR